MTEKQGKKLTLVVVDDEADVRRTIGDHLAGRGHEIRQLASAQEALDLAQSSAVDVIITDLRMPGLDGFELLERIKAMSPQTDVIMITAFGDIESAVRAIRAGAFDFFAKPVRLRDLDAALERITRFRALRQENERYREQVQRLGAEVAERYGLGHIIGDSEAMRRVKEQVSQVCETENTTVLIVGETGTGKELVARAIHYGSDRAQGPFVAVNCSALNPGLVESEFYGHEKGAFTDARKQHKGHFAQADGGTLFLDEIGDMDAAMQTRLLRTLEERRVQPLGASSDFPVDVRVVSATHRDLPTAVRDGTFRQDLLYRINTFAIHVAPLRERPDDVMPLAQHFLRQLSGEVRRTVAGFDEVAVALMREYPYPGNIRELRNMIERALIVCRSDVIGAADLEFQGSAEVFGDSVGQLPSPPTPSVNGLDLAAAQSLELVQLEQAAVSEALRRTSGNQVQAARLLGITRFTLRRRMALYGLDGDSEKG